MPADEPLTRWRCDTCHQDVSAANGSLTFRNQFEEPFLAHDFRIVHTDGCRPSCDTSSADSLNIYLGADGLGGLLAYLTAGPGRPGEPGVAVRDMDEFIDLIRRLHIPYYEQARTEFSRPRILEMLKNDDRWNPYRPANLRRMAEHASMTATSGSVRSSDARHGPGRQNRRRTCSRSLGD